MDFADLLFTLDFSDRLIYYTRKEVTHKLPTHEYNFGGEQMSRFYCREDELQKLNKRYAGDKFECIVIYGALVKRHGLTNFVRISRPFFSLL